MHFRKAVPALTTLLTAFPGTHRISAQRLDSSCHYPKRLRRMNTLTSKSSKQMMKAELFQVHTLSLIQIGLPFESRLSSDIPRDTSGFSGPGFKLPLPEEAEEDEYFDVEIIEAGNDEEGRTLEDIPRDESGANEAGPRLPKKIEDDVEIISVGNEPVDCFEDRDPGTCLNSHEAWFYDPTHNKCHFFIYSGCGGNSNRQA